jgi:undecaprenyl diphosphate synthase
VNVTAKQKLPTIEKSTLPRHVAIIMDGNGRWAKKRGLPRAFGHRAGMERVVKCTRFCSDIGIEVLSLYAFSTENWRRPKEEVGTLMNLLVEFLKRELEELHRNRVKLRMMGSWELLPGAVVEAVQEAIEKTASNGGMVLNIALNYGSRHEILRAVQRVARDVADGKLAAQEIDEQGFSDYLFSEGLVDPDVVIRTSGELRLSNFMLYQAAYSELYFTDTYWPDFDDHALLQALDDYQKRKRRFGGLA